MLFISSPPLYTNRDSFRVCNNDLSDSSGRTSFVLPAHDLVCQQDPTHLWVFILAFIDNCLKNGKKKQNKSKTINKNSGFEFFCACDMLTKK